VGSKRNNRLKPVESSFIPWLKTQGFSLSHYVLIEFLASNSPEIYFLTEIAGKFQRLWFLCQMLSCCSKLITNFAKIIFIKKYNFGSHHRINQSSQINEKSGGWGVG
jgi:hypothetical protein